MPFKLNPITGEFDLVGSSGLTIGTTPITGGTAGSVLFIGSGGVLQEDAGVFYYDNTYNRLGIQESAPDAVLHVNNTVAQTASVLTGVNAGKILFNPLGAPANYTATQSPGHLYAATFSNAYVTGGSSSYSGGEVIDYKIIAYGSGVTYSAVSLDILGSSITNSGDCVNLAWADNLSGTASINGYLIQRQINGLGYSESIDLGYVNSYIDDGSNWAYIAITPVYPDFVATGIFRDYKAYSSSTTPNLHYSASSYDSPLTDDSSGNPYVVTHLVDMTGTGSATARIIDAGFTSHHDGTSFIEDSTTFTAGATVTPTTIGYLSDGSNLNITYDFYKQTSISGYTIYSSAVTSSVTDDNDGNYYYIQLSFTTGAYSAKILKNGWAKLTATSPFFDDGINTFPDSTAVTPNTYYPPNSIFEQGPTQESIRIVENSSYMGSVSFKSGSGLVRGTLNVTGNLGYLDLIAGSSVIGSSVSYLRLATASTLASISDIIFSVSGSSVLTISTSTILVLSGVNLAFGTISGTIIGTSTSQKFGFWGATPIIQPSNTVAINDVLVNTGFRTSGGTSNFSTTLKPRTGSTSSGTEPFQFTSGNLLSTATAGTIEFLTDKFYASITTGPARKELTLNDAALTSGRVPFATTNGRLTDDADMTFATDTLTVTKLVVGGGASLSKIDYGTYTPTLTNTTNLGASTARLATYMRVGNTVTVAGQLDLDPTAAGAVLLGISLPVASALTTAYQLGGTAASTGIAGQVAGIEADATNDRASLKYIAVDITNQTMTYQFSYQVI